MTSRRLTKRRNVLTREVNRERVKALMLDGITDAEIGREMGVSRQAVTAFRGRHLSEIQDAVAEVERQVTDHAIAHKVSRIAGYNSDWQALANDIAAWRMADGNHARDVVAMTAERRQLAQAAGYRAGPATQGRDTYLHGADADHPRARGGRPARGTGLMTSTPAEVRLPLKLRGGNRELYNAGDPEILAEGPAGTGKTRTALELLNELAATFDGLQVGIVRKVHRTMAGSCLREFNQHVLHPGEGVAYHGGSGNKPEGYYYPNGSVIMVLGMDDPEKILSFFFDLVYVNEATELNLDEWEMLTTRLRASDPEHLPRASAGRRVPEGTPFQKRRSMGDAKPTFASHWLMQRTDSGETRLIRSKLQDNPVYYDDEGEPTEEGLDYIAKLDKLSGIRYERFRLGNRVGVENAIYPAFDRLLHVQPMQPALHFKTTIIGVDYGTKHECALVAVSIDQFGRRWVREAWAQADTDEGVTLTRKVGEFKERYATCRGRVDPNQAYLAGRAGFHVAKGAAGSRLHRIDMLEPLFYTFEGGRVPKFSEELNLAVPRGPFAEPDSPGILLVEGGVGIEELAEELEAYHYCWTDSPSGRTKGVYRVDENQIAALEYANEEWEEGVSVELLETRSTPIRRRAPVQESDG